jgi:hypothetical protein
MTRMQQICADFLIGFADLLKERILADCCCGCCVFSPVGLLCVGGSAF